VYQNSQNIKSADSDHFQVKVCQSRKEIFPMNQQSLQFMLSLSRVTPTAIKLIIGVSKRATTKDYDRWIVLINVIVE